MVVWVHTIHRILPIDIILSDIHNHNAKYPIISLETFYRKKKTLHVLYG